MPVLEQVCTRCGWRGGASADSRPYCPECLAPFPSSEGENGGGTARQETIVLEGLAPSAEPAPPSSRTARAPATLPRTIGGLEIHALLGQGGMGKVYLAYDPLLDRQMALKVLRTDAPGQDFSQQAARFLAEAVLTGRLCHPGIVPIYQVGHDVEHGFFYSMRYLKGFTLADVLNARRLGRGGPLVEEYNLTRLLNVFLRVGEAVAFAHGQGVIHRDLKPANIALDRFGQVLVLDWGLARRHGRGEAALEGSVAADDRVVESRKRRGGATRIFLAQGQVRPAGTSLLRRLQSIREADAHQKDMTQDGLIIGTPGYLAPEQAAARTDLAPPCDVYALGAMLFEILTLGLPVAEEDPVGRVAATLEGRLVPVRERLAEVQTPRVLSEMVEKALAHEPAARFRDAGELVRELSEYLEGHPSYRLLCRDELSGGCRPELWQAVGAPPSGLPDGVLLPSGSALECRHASLGDLRCEFDLEPQGPEPQWLFTLELEEPGPQGGSAPGLVLRLGQQARPFVELVRRGAIVQRRLDVRLQAGIACRVKAELEREQLRVWIDDRRCVEFKDRFPQTGGGLRLRALAGRFRLAHFAFWSRGAPLTLSYMHFPDRLYRLGRYAEARELYRQLARSHPDREEGLLATYKTGLCEAELGQTQAAFEEFSRLEGTPLNHCCALGYARVGLLDGNIDWAWEALKSGFLAHRSREVKSDLWFALVGLVESLPEEKGGERAARCWELLRQLRPPAEELARLTFLLLDQAFRSRERARVRAEALALLREFPEEEEVLEEALHALFRVGLDEEALAAARPALDRCLRSDCSAARKALLLLRRAEVEIATGAWDAACTRLREVLAWAAPGSAEELWSRQWELLVQYLREDLRAFHSGVLETAVRFRNCVAPQAAYFRLLEALDHLGRGDETNARRAMEKAAASASLWGQAAGGFLQSQPPAAWQDGLELARAAQVAEAAFLVGEAYRLAGRTELARACQDFCLQGPCPREMVVRQVRARLAAE